LEEDPVYINIFEYRMRSGADLEAYMKLAVEMYVLVSGDPSFEFLDIQTFATSPTEGVVIERFGSLEGARLWASNQVHQAVMQRGQREFYAWYRGSACILDHEYSHPSPIEEVGLAEIG
jgi:hypothetical protein